ncbi:DUF4842 domain-containing protein [uncultured Bacteroides sp.]|uniref:DUF4842 domain-containing protein n=1 Tax=uncultured Bacteroides sp. TaxID=162156 RepID=UPI0026107795|nr:DUF4842 domain-containing protein [uncultured Bacteroides sp.]
MRKIWGLGSLILLGLASCQNEDIYLGDALEAKYAQNWVETFGPVKDGDSWNLADKRELEVTTGKNENVKVFINYGGKHYQVADYTLEKGTHTITFDVPRGTEKVVAVRSGENILPETRIIQLKNGVKASFDGEQLSRAESTTTTLDYTSSLLPVKYSEGTKKGKEIDGCQGNLYLVSRTASKPTQCADYASEIRTSLLNTAGSCLYEGGENFTVLNSMGAIKDIVYTISEDTEVSLDYIYRVSSQRAALGYIVYDSEDDLKDATKLNRYILIPYTSNYQTESQSEWNAWCSGSEKQGSFTNNSWAGTDVLKGTRFKLVYFDEASQTVSYTFPKGKKIMFIHLCHTEFDYEGNLVYGGQLIPDTQNPGNYTDVGISQDNVSYETLRDITIASKSGFNEGKIVGKKGVERFVSLNYTVAGTSPAAGATYTLMGFEDFVNQPVKEGDFNDDLFVLHGSISSNLPTVDESMAIPMTWTLAFEDMGTVGDYDFNDVVVRVEYVSGQGTAKVKLCAAGGTMHKTIFKFPFYYEGTKGTTDLSSKDVHDLFGDSSHKEMINTYNGIEYSFYNYTYNNSEDIPVKKDFSIAEGNGFGSTGISIKVYKSETDGGNDSRLPNGTINGSAGNSSIPQGIAIPGEWKWPAEQIRIDRVYENFGTWGEGFYNPSSTILPWQEDMNETDPATGESLIWTGTGTT